MIQALLRRNTWSTKFLIAVALTLSFEGATAFGAATQNILWTFNHQEGTPSFPYYNFLSRGAKGNLYGLTALGGANNKGAAFQLSPNPDGSWTRTVLFSFAGKFAGEPIGGLTIDSAGNLYGVSSEGGARNTGYVFKLSPEVSGTWSASVIHNFGPCCGAGPDGISPYAGLVMDPAGNLYGTTTYGGTGGFGTIYQLAPNTAGGWTETILHNFASYNAEGGYPESKLTIAPDGRLLGTAAQGGLNVGTCTVGCGTVFELKKQDTGWAFRVLHYFKSTDGQYPRYAGVSIDNAGNLYGATEGGGANQVGTAWRLLYSSADGTYTEQTLHHFGSGSTDGSGPLSGVVVNPSGTRVFGTTPQGGLYGGGTVYTLSKVPNGPWTETILYQFTDGTDGQFPSGGVVVDSATGRLFGMTEGGGAFGDGLVYELIP